MQSGLLLNVIIWKRPSVFKLLPRKDQPLLLWRNSLFVLNLRLDVSNGVVGLDVQSNRLSGEGFDEDLHRTTPEAQNKMQSGLLLNVIIWKRPSVFKLLPRKDQPLLLWRNSLFVLNFRLNVGNRVVGLDVQSNRLSCEGFDEDLHRTTAKTKHKMKGRFFLNVVVWKSPSILKLFPCEDQSLLFWRNALFILNFCLDVSDGVVRLDVESNRLSCEGLDKYLHSHGEVYTRKLY